MILKFVNILAWITVFGSALYIVLSIMEENKYNSPAGALRRSIDSLKGIKRSWPVLRYVIALVVAGAWLLAQI